MSGWARYPGKKNVTTNLGVILYSDLPDWVRRLRLSKCHQGCHNRLHGALEHDAFHDRLQHRSYHRPFGSTFSFGYSGRRGGFGYRASPFGSILSFGFGR